MAKATWRSFVVPLSELDVKPEFILAVESHLNLLTKELQKLLSDPAFMSICEIYREKHRGEFWNLVTRASHKPHLKWAIEGQRAKYFRMILERIRVTMMSLEERQKIADVCSSYEWDDKKINEIREDLIEDGIYPSFGKIKNIVAAKSIPLIPLDLEAFIDYTVGDKQVVRQNGLDYEVEIQGKWYNFSVPEPDHLLSRTGKYAKPVFQRLKSGELIVRIAYEVEKFEAPQRKVKGYLGIDLGKIKPFAAAAVYDDGSYSTELSPSREVSNLANKIISLSREMNYHHVKADHIKKLLAGRPNQYLARHLEDVESNTKRVRSKRTLIKSHMARLVARDVVNHALEHGITVIKLENLKFVSGKGGKWDYARTQQFIREASELHGITVYSVDAKNSSHTDPFSDTYITPRSDRSTELADGSSLDRDYLAALELGRRSRRSEAKKHRKVTIKKKSCRDKFGPTPKRPKRKAKRRIREEMKRNRAGAHVIVVSSDEARAQTHLMEASASLEITTDYTQVLRL